MSYTSVVLGSKFLSLLIRYTAYLKASSALLSFWSSVNMAPVIIQPPREIQSVAKKSQKIWWEKTFKNVILIKNYKLRAGRNDEVLTLEAHFSNSGHEIGASFIDSFIHCL